MRKILRVPRAVYFRSFHERCNQLQHYFSRHVDKFFALERSCSRSLRLPKSRLHIKFLLSFMDKHDLFSTSHNQPRLIFRLENFVVGNLEPTGDKIP